MIAELGQAALILALAFICLQIILPLFGFWRGQPALIQLALPLTWGYFFWLLVAFFILLNRFLSDDFSLLYVASNSNTALPLLYKITAVWGAHEGSLLLWVLILSAWAVAVSIFSKQLPSEMLAKILVVLAFVSLGFLLFLLLTSNPFERLLPVPDQGRELNPLLQDFALAIHPPMLYMGYVGLVVPFAFVLVSLTQGKLDSALLKWSRTWTLLAWAFLTIGIVLGSWWAYYELGWGGWWFWDPVENASFMPWLVAAALVHSLTVAEKRGAFKRWTILLAILAFSMSLLGAFLVRSGVLTSVHSFANDPSRGVFLLVFLLLVVGVSLFLYAFRTRDIKRGGLFALISRESGLLLNNIFMLTATSVVLLGTLYPLFLETLGLAKLSVGAPYFQTVFVPLMVPMVFLMAVVPFLRWKSDDLTRVKEKLHWVWLLILLLSILLAFWFYQSIAFVLALFLFFWLLVHSVYLIYQRLRQKAGVNAGFVGMVLAHIGVAVFLLGATAVHQFGVEKDVTWQVGDDYEMSDYKFILSDLKVFQRDNYQGYQANIGVYQNKQHIATLRPEKRQYQTGLPMTEAAIDAGFWRDIYVALGEPLTDGKWSVRVHYKPLVRWVWLGGLLIALGALICVFDKRYRRP